MAHPDQSVDDDSRHFSGDVDNANTGCAQDRNSDIGATINNQLENFKSTARDLGADESEDAFKARLREIAKAKGRRSAPGYT